MNVCIKVHNPSNRCWDNSLKDTNVNLLVSGKAELDPNPNKHTKGIYKETYLRQEVRNRLTHRQQSV